MGATMLSHHDFHDTLGIVGHRIRLVDVPVFSLFIEAGDDFLELVISDVFHTKYPRQLRGLHLVLLHDVEFNRSRLLAEKAFVVGPVGGSAALDMLVEEVAIRAQAVRRNKVVATVPHDGNVAHFGDLLKLYEGKI